MANTMVAAIYRQHNENPLRASTPTSSTSTACVNSSSNS